MENVKYACPDCGYTAENPGLCLSCQTILVATCAVCGNPMVGEHIHLED